MSENKNLRKCSRCHATKLEDYFSTNTKGELFKLCDNCRNKKQVYDKDYRIENEDRIKEYRIENKDRIKESNDKSYMKFLEKPLIQCDRCRANIYDKKSEVTRHRKRWSCVKEGMDGNPGLKEKYQWILENKDDLLNEFKKLIPKAEEYFRDSN